VRQIAICDLIQSHDTPNQAVVCDLASAHQLGASRVARGHSLQRPKTITDDWELGMGMEMGLGMGMGMEMGLGMRMEIGQIGLDRDAPCRARIEL
jgi:hypothetical protein